MVISIKVTDKRKRNEFMKMLKESKALTGTSYFFILFAALSKHVADLRKAEF